MSQKLKNVLLVIATVASALVPTMALSSATVFADVSTTPDIANNTCAGLNLDPTGANTSCTTNTDLTSILGTIINYFSIFVGVIAVLMIIVGGLRYITSGGDANKISGAKNTIMYALIGLVVVALSQVLVHFVFTEAQSVANT